MTVIFASYLMNTINLTCLPYQRHLCSLVIVK
jgi:hypothetical protein